MANLLARMKTYNFWISLVSAVILVLRIVGDKFNFFVDATLIMDITTGLCGIFVVLGIISAPSGKKEEKVEELNPIGRFEQIQSETSEAEEDNCDNVEEELVEIIEVSGKAEENSEVAEIKENENEIVENDAIMETKIQSEIKNEQKITKETNPDKEEIKELLMLLIEKIDSI